MIRLLAEFLGTAFLVIAVIGSGIMGDRLSDDSAVSLLANAIATGAALYWLIIVFGPVSGAQFNPIVSLWAWSRGDLPLSHVIQNAACQTAGGLIGVLLTHLMFDLPLVEASAMVRSGIGQWAGEVVATFGLILTIAGGLAHRRDALPAMVALYITGAYWFTSSTSFANPAVTLARALSDTFAGIAPTSVPAFILAQLAGLALAIPVTRLLFPPQRD